MCVCVCVCVRHCVHVRVYQTRMVCMDDSTLIPLFTFQFPHTQRGCRCQGGSWGGGEAAGRKGGRRSPCSGAWGKDGRGTGSWRVSSFSVMLGHNDEREPWGPPTSQLVSVTERGHGTASAWRGFCLSDWLPKIFSTCSSGAIRRYYLS